MSRQRAETVGARSSVPLPLIFDRFYWPDDARARGGRGLGLTIARWTVETHGGRVHSNPVNFAAVCIEDCRRVVARITVLLFPGN